MDDADFRRKLKVSEETELRAKARWKCQNLAAVLTKQKSSFQRQGELGVLNLAILIQALRDKRKPSESSCISTLIFC